MRVARAFKAERDRRWAGAAPVRAVDPRRVVARQAAAARSLAAVPARLGAPARRAARARSRVRAAPRCPEVRVVPWDGAGEGPASRGWAVVAARAAALGWTLAAPAWTAASRPGTARP